MVRSAAGRRIVMPPITPPARTGLAPTRVVLDNAAVVIAKETHTVPAVTISMAMRSGSVCDPKDAPGTVHLLSRVIDRGTTGRSADDIAEALDSRGISLAINVTRQIVSVVCTCLSEDFEAVFALLGDVLSAPSLPERELVARKSEVVTAIRQDEDNTAVRAVETLMALLYPDGHPYGRPAKGTIEVVEALTRDRLARFHAGRFAPSELVTVVVGDVPADVVIGAATRVLGTWRAPVPAAVALPPVVPAMRRERVVVPMMSKAQADIAYGFTSITRSDPAYYAFWLMNNIFGQYSMGGRLGDSIRERQGMAYYVGSAFEAGVVEGPLMIRAGVSPANVDRAIASIDEEIARLIREGITEKELAESRQYLIGSMPRALETNAGIAGFLLNAELFDLGLDYDVRLPALLGAVTLDEVSAAARRAFDPGRATVVIAGPYEAA